MTTAVADSMPRRPLSQWLAEKPSWSLTERLVLARRLALAIQALHRQGQIHRSVDAATVTIDGQFEPQLAPPAGPRRFGGEQSDPEFCPPELAQGAAVELPAEIEAARTILHGRGTPLDPRRIDVYQFGVLLCRLLTGEPFLNYLYSPTCKTKVPPPARAVLESCLGENAAGALVDCDGLVKALDDLIAQLPERQATSTLETPPSGSVVLSLGDTPPHGQPVAPSGAAPDRNNQALPFQRLGHFQIISQIGFGGMGDVYKGYDASLDRYVAIKVLAPALARDEEFVRRFTAEATAAAKVSHPNVVPIYFIGQDAGYHFFAMQFIEGQSLAQRLACEKRLPADEAVAVIKQCLAGLGAAHAQGLIHRDVKPGNILLEQATGRAVLVDFGLVRHLGGNTRMTATGVLMGTVNYIAPEQARGKAVDGRADIYSLGVMFYELLAGRLPFLSDSPTAMIFQHAYEEPFPLKQAVPDVPQPLVDIIAHMMAKEPAERYPSCAAVLADLRAFRQGSLPSPVGRVAGSEGHEADDWAFAADASLLPPEAPWQRAKDWAATLFRRYAPEYVQEMQGTTMQMDGAVAEYQRRRDRLKKLLEEARAMAGELPREQIENLEQQLGVADATLAQLRSQQNLLKARLQAAEAQRQLDGGRPQPKRRRWVVPMAIAAALVALVSLLLILPKAPPPSDQPTAVEEPPPVTPGQVDDAPVTEGVGWGGFRVGATREELLRTFGPPDPNPNPQIQWISWKSKYHVDCLIDALRGAFEVRFNEGFRLPLSSGIKIGSPESEVLSAYGAPDRVVNNAQAKMLQYNKRGVLMWIIGGTVFDFTVFKPTDAASTAGKAPSPLRAGQRAKALERMRRDKGVFSPQELDEINSLYHAAGKGPETEEARKTRLKTLVAKYPKSNRAGCAVLYLGQMTRGDEQIAYFKQAIAEFGDCYYGDGVQVGAYARLLLGKAYLERGRAREAGVLFDDIRSNYPDSVNHGGDSLVAQLPPVVPIVEAAVASPGNPAAALSSEQQVLIVGNTPYWQTLTDLARRKGMTVGKSFNYNYDQWLPLAKGQILLIETHDLTPIVPLSVLDKYYPGASEGLKTPEGIVSVGNTKIVFVDLSRLLKAAIVESAGVVPSERQVYIVGNSPYWQTLTDMAQRKGMVVAKSFNMQYDEFLPLAKGHVLLVETHDGVPIVPLPVLESVFPNASDGLKTPEGVVNIGSTRIVFVDFARLLGTF